MFVTLCDLNPNSKWYFCCLIILILKMYMNFRKLAHFLLILMMFVVVNCKEKPSPSAISTSVANSSQEYRKVYKVIDGDTFWMKDGFGQIEKIRLTGIDAPESRKSSHKDIQRFGKESKDFLTNLLKGKKVAFEYDVQKKDQYGRTLAYVYLEDGTFLNDYLIRNGYAKVVTFPPNVKYHKRLLASERYARQHSLGMWKEK